MLSDTSEKILIISLQKHWLHYTIIRKVLWTVSHCHQFSVDNDSRYFFLSYVFFALLVRVTRQPVLLVYLRCVFAAIYNHGEAFTCRLLAEYIVIDFNRAYVWADVVKFEFITESILVNWIFVFTESRVVPSRIECTVGQLLEGVELYPSNRIYLLSFVLLEV